MSARKGNMMYIIAGLVFGMLILIIIGSYSVGALETAGEQAKGCGVLAQLAADITEGAVEFC